MTKGAVHADPYTRAKKIKANGLAVRKLRVEINGQTDRSDCVTVLASVDGNKQGISLRVVNTSICCRQE